MSSKSHREFAGSTTPSINRRLARRNFLRQQKFEPLVNAYKLGYDVNPKRPYTTLSALNKPAFVDVGERHARVAPRLRTRSKYLPTGKRLPA